MSTMRLITLLSCLLAAFVTGCHLDESSQATVGVPQLTTDELREGCVATTLDLMQDIVDLIAPATSLGSVEDLIRLASDSGCALVVDSANPARHTLICPNVTVRGQLVTLRAELTYFAGELPATDPGDADRLRVELDASGAELDMSGTLLITTDPERGLIVDGTLDSAYLVDGCDVEGTLSNVTARTIADLPGTGLGALFTSGSIDLGVEVPGGAFASGTAALIGRRALVALEIGGVFTQGEVAFD